MIRDLYFNNKTTGGMVKHLPPGVSDGNVVEVAEDEYAGTGTVLEVIDEDEEIADSSDKTEEPAVEPEDTTDSGITGDTEEGEDADLSDDGSDEGESAQGDDGSDKEDTAEGCKMKDKGKSLVRHGRDACIVDGTWIKKANTLYTSDPANALGFRFHDLKPGKYEVMIMARHYRKSHKKHHHKHHEKMKAYEVALNGDGFEKMISMKASDTNEEKGIAELDLAGGKTDIFVSWINVRDDINFQLHSIKLKRIGDYTKSSLAAYLLGSESGNRVLVGSSLVFVAMLLGAFFLINRRRAQKE